ncbi:MAG: hypothetical protein OEO20_11295 [Gemmatimonadota bacterium]|nr:hypothetical protein [Gemmatimonadota bacterium]MDH3291586.1 hypothetical protein [Gemmatimonadota bacterium]MDH3366489.1 hypothetical protein [Gemmatimonadota bacterium]MDH3478878.1 hypothetical protein [Gemmatimonadota bacterium]MDH3570982.1 hypothetical protein [Gemmatimonadota bacterium]
MNRDQYRIARRERIAAGKTLAFDLDDETDIVCPYCGAYEERPTLTNEQLLERNFETICRSCRQSFGVSVTIRVLHTTCGITVQRGDDR